MGGSAIALAESRDWSSPHYDRSWTNTEHMQGTKAIVYEPRNGSRSVWFDLLPLETQPYTKGDFLWQSSLVRSHPGVPWPMDEPLVL